jgi:putative SOS response-associated peptidase YedK
MCGRFGFCLPSKKALAAFGLEEAVEWPLRHNISPTMEIAVALRDEQGRRVGRMLRWGLIPSWAKDRSWAQKCINARAETVAEKPAFRDAYKKRRCLILADCFYEWRLEQEGRKTPHAIFMADKTPFAMAGLWERWLDPLDPDAIPLETCVILTTQANALVAAIHPRMPVIVKAEEYALWLDPSRPAQTVLAPYPAETMRAIAADPRAGDPLESE